MTPLLQVSGIAHNLKAATLQGEYIKKYASYKNAKFYTINSIELMTIRFSTEQEGKEFIQILIDDGVPFLDAERTYAYSDVMDFIRDGRLHGNPVRSTWKDGKYTIQD